MGSNPASLNPIAGKSGNLSMNRVEQSIRYLLTKKTNMITKIFLSPNDELSPCVIIYDSEKEDYVLESIPSGLTRAEIIELVDEIKRVTGWEV